MTGDNGLPSWEPRELGLPWATLVAIVLAAAITTCCVWISTVFWPKPLPQALQVTQVTLAQLPQPAPPPSPQPSQSKAAPPPKPLPKVIPKPPPVSSHIAVASKPPPPVRHIYKPAPHPVLRDAPSPVRKAPPPPPTPAPVSAAPPVAAATPAAAPAPTSGIPRYGEQMYAIIETNQNVPFALSQMGASGTAVIEIVVAPDGRVLSARVYKSSGVPLIDATALDHARNAQLPPFNSEMLSQPHSFLVPIQVQPSTND